MTLGNIPRHYAKAQAIIARTLTASAQISRVTRVADGSGGQTDTYAVVATLPCSYSVSGIRPLERENATQIRSIVVWNFVFAAGTDIQFTDRILVDGRTFEVVSHRTGSIELATRVICMEIE